MIVDRILAHKGDKFIQFLESMDGLLFMELSHLGTVLDVSNSAASLAKYEPDWIGRNIMDVITPGPDLEAASILQCAESFNFTLGATGRVYRGRTCQCPESVFLVAELLISSDDRLMEMMSRTNNEMVSLTRELRVKNRDLEAANRRIEELMLTDVLTGLPNRRSAYQRFDLEAARAQRHARALSFILGDIDHFKSVNDTYGHQAGDQVLAAVASQLDRSIRKTDLAARWGGEEFALILPDTDLSQAAVLAHRIVEAVASISRTASVPGVTISLGVSQWKPGQSIEQLAAAADRALYRAKAQGRNRFILDSD